MTLRAPARWGASGMRLARMSRGAVSLAPTGVSLPAAAARRAHGAHTTAATAAAGGAGASGGVGGCDSRLGVSEDDVARFRRDGFLVVPDLLGTDLAEQLAERVPRLFHGEFETGAQLDALMATHPAHWHWHAAEQHVVGLRMLITRRRCIPGRVALAAGPWPRRRDARDLQRLEKRPTRGTSLRPCASAQHRCNTRQ